MDTGEFAELLSAEADRAVTRAPGTRTASQTFKLMMAMRRQLLRGEEVLSWSTCVVPAKDSETRPGLAVLTDQTIYLAFLSGPAEGVEDYFVSRELVPSLQWRAIALADGSPVAVVPGLPDFAVPPGISREWDENFASPSGDA